LEEAHKGNPDGKRDPQHDTPELGSPAPVQEKQQRQQGSTRQEDFEHEVGAELLSQSAQHR
jgi:hypothetical protein